MDKAVSSSPESRSSSRTEFNAFADQILPSRKASINARKNEQSAAFKGGKPGLNRGMILSALLVGIGYYLGAKIGLSLTIQPHPVSVLWPPNAFLLAALLLVRPGEWWLLLAAAFPAHCLAQLQSHVSPGMIFCWYISNCSEALIGAGSIFYLVGVPFRLDTLRNLGAFLVCPAFLAPLLSSFLDCAFVRLNHWTEEDFWSVWKMRFFSNVLSALTIAPVILSLGSLKLSALWRLPRRHLFEGIALALSLLAVSCFVFLRLDTDAGLIPMLLYAPLPFLLWAAVRFGVGGATSAGLVVSLIAIWGAAHGRGPFAAKSPEESTLSVQLFLTAVSINMMALGVILTERRKFDYELRAVQEQYREVVECQTDLVCRYLPDTTITFANQAFFRFFARTRDEVIGRKFLDFIGPGDHESTLQMIHALITTRRTTIRENQLSPRNGRPVWVQWRSYVVSVQDGEVRELQAVGHDITDRKRAEEVGQSLSHVSRLAVVGELTAMIAHELNQPLGAISSNADAAEMLLETAEPPIGEVANILAEIRKNVMRASEAIHRIRALLRKREMESKPVHLNETIQDVIHLVTGDALRRHIQIKHELEAGLPQVLGDKVQLQHVFINLIVNGMDAMQDAHAKNRCILIKTAVLGQGFCNVLIRDWGHGIPPEKLTQVFDSFYTTKKDGMGLGLPMARAIVEAHRGQIWAENNPDQGATLRVTLPSLKTISPCA